MGCTLTGDAETSGAVVRTSGRQDEDICEQ